MKKLVIAVDCDDVLVPSTERVVGIYNARYGTSVKLAEAYLSANPDWQVDREEALRRIYSIQLTPEYSQTAPFEDAINVCRRLADNHELHLVTARASEVMSVTMSMIDQYFPDVFAEIEHIGDNGNKGEICQKLSADVLIDDNLKHLETARACGVANLIWFGDYPWNKPDEQPEGIVRCSDWAEVEKEIERIARLQLEG